MLGSLLGDWIGCPHLPCDTALYDLLPTCLCVGAESPTRPVWSGGAGPGSVRPAAAGTGISQAPPAAEAAAVDSSRPVTSPRERPTAEGEQEAGIYSSTVFSHIGLNGQAAFL